MNENLVIANLIGKPLLDMANLVAASCSTNRDAARTIKESLLSAIPPIDGESIEHATIRVLSSFCDRAQVVLMARLAGLEKETAK